MLAVQGTLFAEEASGRNQLGRDYIADIRQRLERTLASVERATAMPWPRLEDVIHAENDFRSAAALLAPDEGGALWTRFDGEMNRLYAIMNEGKELPAFP